MAHLVDGIVILIWTYVLEPILLHFDVKGFHLSLNMKETSQRITWITLIIKYFVQEWNGWVPSSGLRRLMLLLKTAAAPI